MEEEWVAMGGPLSWHLLFAHAVASVDVRPAHQTRCHAFGDSTRYISAKDSFLGSHTILNKSGRQPHTPGAIDLGTH